MPDIDSAEELENLFHEWLNQHPVSYQTQKFELEFANHRVAYCFHDPELSIVYGRAVKHRRVAPSTSPDTTIQVIAGNTNELTLPRLGWKATDFGCKRKVPGWSDEVRSVLFLRTERGVAVYNHQTSNGYLWLPGASTIPWWEHAAPMRWFNDLIAAQFGQAAIHAAAVGKDGKGVLIAGPGGAGKSTLALACLGKGLDFVGDDYCVADTGSGLVCHSLYNTAKWNRHSRALPKWVETVPAEAGDRSIEKEIVHIDEFLPSRIALKVGLGAIIVPHLTGDTAPRLERCRPETAFRALAPSTLAQSEAEGRQVVAVLSELAQRLPGYLFHMPSSPDNCGAYLVDNLDCIA